MGIEPPIPWLVVWHVTDCAIDQRRNFGGTIDTMPDYITFNKVPIVLKNTYKLSIDFNAFQRHRQHVHHYTCIMFGADSDHIDMSEM